MAGIIKRASNVTRNTKEEQIATTPLDLTRLSVKAIGFQIARKA